MGREPGGDKVRGGKGRGGNYYSRPMQILGPLLLRGDERISYLSSIFVCKILGWIDRGRGRHGRDLPVKRQILPPWTDCFPPFRSELLSILPIEVSASVHGKNVILDYCLLGYEKRGFPVWASAFGQDGVGDCHSAIGRDYGVQAQGW